MARTEIEAEATAALDPAAWPRSEARDIIRTIVRREPLMARFAIRQKKRRRDFGGLELSVDDVSIRHGRELAGELKELEVEYKSGRRSELTRVAKLIERSGLATPEPRSKMTLAAAMVEGAPSVIPVTRWPRAAGRCWHVFSSGWWSGSRPCAAATPSPSSRCG